MEGGGSGVCVVCVCVWGGGYNKLSLKVPVSHIETMVG